MEKPEKPPRTPEEILEYTQNRDPDDMAADFKAGVRAVGPERFAAMQIALQDAIYNNCECSVCYGIRSVYSSIWDKPHE